MKIEPCLGDGDARANIDAVSDFGFEAIGGEMAPRIERYNTARVVPLREGADGGRRKSIGEVGSPDWIERARRNRQRTIKRVGAAVTADDIAVPRPGHRTDDRSAFARGRRSPVDREARFAAGLGVRGQTDMIGSI